MEKSVSLRGHEVTFSIWDIGGHKDFESMLPLVCNDAAAMLLLFDLSKPETLDSIRVWHQKARERNKCAMPLLVGCKFDLMLEAPVEEQQHVLWMSHQFAKAINSPLIFCAPSVPINVTNVFKMILINLFHLERSVRSHYFSRHSCRCGTTQARTHATTSLLCARGINPNPRPTEPTTPLARAGSPIDTARSACDPLC